MCQALEAAKHQAETDATELRTSGGSTNPSRASGECGSYVYTLPTDIGSSSQEVHEALMPVAPKSRRFFISANLDTKRIGRDMRKYAEEIIQHLTSVDGISVKVSLEVESSDSFTQQTVRTISENCRTLRIRDLDFEE